MARFPLRLRAALAKAKLFHGRLPIRYLRAEEILHSQGKVPVSHEAVRELIRDRHSIVWIDGSDPLDHPGIGHLTRLVGQSGHFLFLETNAIALRQRIHEFQPNSRFYLVVRFFGNEAEHDRFFARPGAFRAALEGIHAARLSGFYVCAKVEAVPGSANDVAALCAELEQLDLDGTMIASPQIFPANSAWSKFWATVESCRSASTLPPMKETSKVQSMGTTEADCQEVTQLQ
jgi:hypothetical protein